MRYTLAFWFLLFGVLVVTSACYCGDYEDHEAGSRNVPSQSKNGRYAVTIDKEASIAPAQTSRCANNRANTFSLCSTFFFVKPPRMAKARGLRKQPPFASLMCRIGLRTTPHKRIRKDCSSLCCATFART